ncbi:hypothetical protein B6N60_02038 [Richelia sinica FACHB-800]|uniref:Uncharacterized protein n=1 Tax=Richelia sinica FACHB-800 TaxID=1357546 RepID=A0A975T8F2_9NOST|nr:hypothetical protein B6N60_02038 [Richelia sinica FACHB-800]
MLMKIQMQIRRSGISEKTSLELFGQDLSTCAHSVD